MSEAEREAKERGEPTMVRASHILVESEEMVDALEGQLGAATFESLAKSMSKCPSKDKGGDLGWFKRYQMVPEFEKACFDNAPGTIVKVSTQFGWHLIKVQAHGTSSGTISVRELHERMNNIAQKIDVRERIEVKQANLGEDFINLPMGEYAQWAQDFEDGKLGLDKSKETVVLCHHGVRSNNFCQFLAQQGFEKVRNIVGGIDLYSKEIDDQVPRY